MERVTYLNSTGRSWKLKAQAPVKAELACLFIGLVLLLPFKIKLYSSKCTTVTWVLWVTFVNNQNWGNHEKSWISSELISSAGALEIPKLQLTSEVKATLLAAVSLTCEICTTASQYCNLLMHSYLELCMNPGSFLLGFKWPYPKLYEMMLLETWLDSLDSGNQYCSFQYLNQAQTMLYKN